MAGWFLGRSLLLLVGFWLAGALTAGPASGHPEDVAEDVAYFDPAESGLGSREGEPRPLPDDAELVEKGATIGRILIVNQGVFDPEDRGFYHLANRLHTTTRPSVIEQQLLFETGDLYDPRILQETARLLRRLDFLRDAKVEKIAYYDNRVDIRVTTRDVWTLGLAAGFERSGGDNAFQAQIEDANLLGTGRLLDLKYGNDLDRSSLRLRFVDPALFGTRAELRLWYADNSDGHRRIFDLAKPFIGLDTRWSTAVKVLSDQRTEKLYDQGHIAVHHQHDKSLVEISGGLSRGWREGRTHRFFVGYTYEHDRFTPKLSLGALNPSPVDRRLSYLWLGWEKIEDQFIETRHINQLGRTEDFNLGHELRARLGWSATAWGGDQDRAIFSLASQWGFALSGGQLLLARTAGSGRWGRDGAENLRWENELRYYRPTLGQHRLLIDLELSGTRYPDREAQLLLGGDSGLRGYANRFQDGDRRVLLSVEQRFYTDWEFFKIVRVGAAAFVDIGRAWYSDPNAAASPGGTLRDQGWLKDIGLGLRLSSSRSARGQMIHLDLAYPLDGDTQKVQFLVKSQKSF